MANLIKEHDLCQDQLTIEKAAAQKCFETSAPELQWYQDPKVVWGGWAVSFSLGATLIATKCFSFCK
jgi:hypothetical protein